MPNLCNRCYMNPAIEDYPAEFGGDFHPLCFTCICNMTERDETEGTLRPKPSAADFPQTPESES